MGIQNRFAKTKKEKEEEKVMEIKSRIELPLLMKHFNLPMIGCEVGVCGGSNAHDLLLNGIEKLYCVDAWVGDEHDSQKYHNDNYKLTLILLSEFHRSRYEILKGWSNEMYVHIPDNSLGLVYIDGGHDFQTVRSDLRNYAPKLVEGGIIGLHDFLNIKGVRVAVKEYARLNFLEIHVIPETGRGDAGCWMQMGRTIK